MLSVSRIKCLALEVSLWEENKYCNIFSFQVEDPLNQAIRFLRPLQSLASERIETHLLAFEIYIRKDKLLLMLQSIKRAWLIDPHNPKLHSNLIRFYHIGMHFAF